MPETETQTAGNRQTQALCPLTVVVLTKNEEDNIAACLNSVRAWADEVIVVDDESTDRTVAIAEKIADKVYHKKMTNEGRHRNWAYAQARNEWVLSLDADELVSEELRDEIIAELKEPRAESFAIPLKTYIGDTWIRHSGWYPASKMRLFMKSKQWYEEVEVHPRLMNHISCGQLTKDIIHTGYPDFAHFFASVNRQTTLEAKKWVNSNRKVSLGWALWRTFDRIWRAYFRKKALKDGFYGFMIAYFASMYQILSYVKYCEMKGLLGKS